MADPGILALRILMKTFLCLFLLAIFWFLSTIVMIGLSAAVGFTLHWIWPQVEAGGWILVSLIAGALSFRLLLRVLSKVKELEFEESEKTMEEEQDWLTADLPLRLPFVYRPRKKRPAKRKTGD
jgi:hypothetical protein